MSGLQNIKAEDSEKDPYPFVTEYELLGEIPDGEIVFSEGNAIIINLDKIRREQK